MPFIFVLDAIVNVMTRIIHCFAKDLWQISLVEKSFTLYVSILLSLQHSKGGVKSINVDEISKWANLPKRYDLNSGQSHSRKTVAAATELS